MVFCIAEQSYDVAGFWRTKWVENPFGEPLQVEMSVGRTAAPVAVFLMQPSCPFIGQLGWFFLRSEVS